MNKNIINRIKASCILVLLVTGISSVNAKTIIVNSLSDSPAIDTKDIVLKEDTELTLRQALELAEDGDIIKFDFTDISKIEDGTLPAEIVLKSPLNSTKNVTIDGSRGEGNPNLILRPTEPGISTFRTFNVKSQNGPLTLQNITFLGGNVTDNKNDNDGGVILLEKACSLQLYNCSLSKGVADNGSGIYASQADSISVQNCSVFECTGNGAISIKNTDNVDVSSNDIYSNESNASSKGNDRSAGMIISTPNKTLYITNNRIQKNTLNTPKGSSGAAGLYIKSGKIKDVVEISGNEVDSNNNPESSTQGGFNVTIPNLGDWSEDQIEITGNTPNDNEWNGKEIKE